MAKTLETADYLDNSPRDKSNKHSRPRQSSQASQHLGATGGKRQSRRWVQDELKHRQYRHKCGYATAEVVWP